MSPTSHNPGQNRSRCAAGKHPVFGGKSRLSTAGVRRQDRHRRLPTQLGKMKSGRVRGWYNLLNNMHTLREDCCPFFFSFFFFFNFLEPNRACISISLQHCTLALCTLQPPRHACNAVCWNPQSALTASTHNAPHTGPSHENHDYLIIGISPPGMHCAGTGDWNRNRNWGCTAAHAHEYAHADGVNHTCTRPQ